MDGYFSPLCIFCLSPIIVLIDAKFQKNIATNSRATVTSLRSFLQCIIAIFLSFTFGAISSLFNITAGYMFYGLILVFMGIWVVFENNHQ